MNVNDAVKYALTKTLGNLLRRENLAAAVIGPELKKCFL